MSREGFLLFQSAIATTVCNLNSDSRDRFSTEKRTEGWTESWGDDNDADAVDNCWENEQFVVANLFSPTANSMFPEISLTVVQYRPAWLEQLVLAMAGIPHVVINSPHASYDSTGPLPVLEDLNGKNFPVLVGRRQPGLAAKVRAKEDSTHTPENDILQFLQTERGVDLDQHLVDPDNETLTKQRQSTSKLLQLLVTTQLRHSLTVLRYEDADAWGQVYRQQCLDASRNHGQQEDASSSSKQQQPQPLFPSARGWYQAWSERVMARRTLMGRTDAVDLEQAKRQALMAYGVLEQQLSQRKDDQLYMLGTNKPALIDAMVWAHLAEAMCDVHLVVILADFPLLIRYFQGIHQTFFAVSTSSSSDTTKASWKVWNNHQNGINCFQQVPLCHPADGTMNTTGDGQPATEGLKNLKHALELMQTLSAQDYNLLDVLQKGKEARSQELANRWKQRRETRMEESNKESDNSDDDNNNNKQNRN